jgi:hypothetical protein
LFERFGQRRPRVAAAPLGHRFADSNQVLVLFGQRSQGIAQDFIFGRVTSGG